MELQRLNSADPAAARAQFESCCRSTKWAKRMVREMPFNDVATVLQAAGEAWRSLGDEDRLAALEPPPSPKPALARCLEDYRSRFGWSFVVAEEADDERLLEVCSRRIENAPDEERRRALSEQEEIIDRRLRAMLGVG